MFNFTNSNPSQAASSFFYFIFWLLNLNPSLGCEEKGGERSRGQSPLPGGCAAYHRELTRYPFSACLSALSILKRAPRKRPGRVAFDGTTVFYFPRCQGFTSVPSRGGCTLGMAPRHSACRRFSLTEFAQEQARTRQEKLRLRLKEEKLEVLRSKVGDPSKVHSEVVLALRGGASGAGAGLSAIWGRHAWG